jgi:hypothetical protein
MNDIENVFQPIPMAVFDGYTKIGTIYPKGWTYNGVELTEDLAVPSKPKYAKKLLKEMNSRR